MSVLALLGLRYPLRMLPILLFEVAWKLTWLGVVALPLWSEDKLDAATREQAARSCGWSSSSPSFPGATCSPST